VDRLSRPTAGGFDPLERLTALRHVFSRHPGHTLGRRPTQVRTQGDDPTHATFAAAGDPRTYARLVTPEGLTFVATYAKGIGACKDVLIPKKADGTLGEPSPVIADAHRAGLIVHGWTFRRENRFLPIEYRRGSDPNAAGDMVGEVRAFLAAGMDGFFTDNSDLGAEAAT
jgi:glycerophosphoryl diester phosphodiesterase